MAAKKKTSSPASDSTHPGPSQPSTRRRAGAEPPDVTPGGRAQVPCLSCGLCCSYIAVEIDPPTTVKRASQMLWYLYHEQVSVYWDRDEEWLLQFQTRCRHIDADNKCGIYAVRPHICREFDADSCEVNVDDEGISFYDADQFLNFLKTRRKAIYRKLDPDFIPDRGRLIGPPAVRSKLAPFDKRFRKLRTLA